MSAKAVIGLVAAVAIVATAAWYYTNTQSIGIPGPGTETSETETNANEGTNTLASLFAMTGSYRCTVSSSEPNSETDGIVYIADGNVRGDFMSTISAGGTGAVEMHMLKSGNSVYVWSDMMPQGMKMNAAMMMNGGSPSASAAFDPNVSVNYSCAPVAVDASLFTPPADVQFMTL